MNEYNEASAMAYRRYLAALPEVAPPHALWGRLHAAHRAPTSRASGRRVGLALAAAVAGVALLAWQVKRSDPAIDAATAWVPPRQPATAATDPGLRRLDDEIRLAYARNADEPELAALWQTRARLIEALDDPAPALLARL